MRRILVIRLSRHTPHGDLILPMGADGVTD